MAIQTSSDTFAGGAGAAWPNPTNSGGYTSTGWNFANTGTFTTGPTTTVNGSNQGEQDGNASAVGIQTALETQALVTLNTYLTGGVSGIATGFEIQANFTRSAVSGAAGTQDIEGGLVLMASGNSPATNNFYLLRTREFSSGGKSPSQQYSITLSRVASGVETIIADSGNLGTSWTASAAKAINMKFRAFPMTNGTTLLIGKAWSPADVSEPAWPSATTLMRAGASVTATVFSAVIAIIDNTSAFQPYAAGNPSPTSGTNSGMWWGLYSSWATTGTDFFNLWSSYNTFLLQPSDGPDFWLPGDVRNRPSARLVAPYSRKRLFVPAQAAPPPTPSITQLGTSPRQLQGLLLQRGKAVTPTPPQFNPPLNDPRRLPAHKRILPQPKGRQFVPTPAQDQPTPERRKPPAHRRIVPLIRGRRAFPTPAQEQPQFDVRRPPTHRRIAALVSGRRSFPTPAQVNPPLPDRRRLPAFKRIVPLIRGRQWTTSPPQIVVPNPKITQLRTSPRRLAGLLLRRGYRLFVVPFTPSIPSAPATVGASDLSPQTVGTVDVEPFTTDTRDLGDMTVGVGDIAYSTGAVDEAVYQVGANDQQ